VNQQQSPRSPSLALGATFVILLSTSAASPAGEKIIFSGRADSRPTVDLNRKEPLMDRGLHTPKLPGDSPADSLSISVAPPQPKPRLTRRQQEELDERRDWMFRNPNAQSGDQPAKSSRTDDEKEPDPRRKTAIERFVEGPAPKTDGDTAGSEKSGESQARRESTGRAALRPDGSREGGAGSSGSPARDFSGEGSRNPAGPPGSADLRGFEFTGRVALDPTRERVRTQARDADSAAFQRAIGGSLASDFGTGSALSQGAGAPGRDSFSAPGSATRVYLLAPGAVVPGGTKGGAFDGARFGTASTFDARQAPGATGSTLPPTEPAKKFEQRPTVLDIPKRKF